MGRIAALALIGAALTGVSSLRAQERGTLVGTVRDRMDLPVESGNLGLIHTQTGVILHTVTNSSGGYVFDNLPSGTYSLQVSAPNFRQLHIDGIEIHVATTLRQDATLDLAPVSTAVAVESATPMVKTESAEIGQLVDGAQIADLPLNGRDVFSLLRLAGGAETGVSATARFTNIERPALAGDRAGYSGWMAWISTVRISRPLRWCRERMRWRNSAPSRSWRRRRRIPLHR